MKKILAALILITLFSGPACNSQQQALPETPHNKKGASYTLTGDEKRLLLSGDIILRRGEGMISDGIADMLNETFDVTHSGVVLYENDSLWVVHAMQDKERDLDGIFAQNLDQFVAESREGSVIVVRLKTTEDRTPKLIRRIHYYLKQDIPFDLGFNAADPKQFYCNELLQHIFLETYGVDIFPITQPLPTTDLLKYTYLFDTTVFTPVINHHLAHNAPTDTVH